MPRKSGKGRKIKKLTPGGKRALKKKLRKQRKRQGGGLDYPYNR
jgi:hypothetical protein